MGDIFGSISTPHIAIESSEFADMRNCFLARQAHLSGRRRACRMGEIDLVSRAQPGSYDATALGPSLAPKSASTARFAPCLASSSMSVSEQRRGTSIRAHTVIRVVASAQTIGSSVRGESLADGPKIWVPRSPVPRC
jgi:hypothetical protein